MIFIVAFAILLIIIIASALLMRVLRRRLGVLVNPASYQDSEKSPGEILYAKSSNLVGKPDYLIRQNGKIIPVEVKSGTTPKEPYLNHIMQLMAYCMLVEENYDLRPDGGYLKYPTKEFKIAYTDEAKDSIKLLINEITESARKDLEFFCEHPQHNNFQK